MLPVLLKLLSLAPSAISLYKTVKTEEKPALIEKVVAVATEAVKLANPKVTASTLSVEEILQQTSIPQVKESVITAIESLAMEELTMRLADVQHARVNTSATDRPLMLAMAQHIMKYNILYCVLLVLAQIATIHLFKGNEVMVALIANLIGILASQLLSERLQVLNYYFGASAVPETKPKNKEL